MPVTVKGHLDRRVTELGLDRFRIRSGGDEERGAGVPKVVDPNMVDTRLLKRWPPEPNAEFLAP